VPTQGPAPLLCLPFPVRLFRPHSEVLDLSKIAWVFPGQGIQFPGMGKELYKEFKIAREVFHSADRALGFKFSRVIFEGSSDDLTLTYNAQPAILIVSVACARVLESHGVKPDMTAGLSLGEYSALVIAGSLTLEEAVIITRKRGKYMQEACLPGQGSMAAIIGLTCAEVEAICFESSKLGVVTGANYNCPGQIVISGSSKAVLNACRKAQEQGGKAIPLAVSAPFHCSLMEPAAVKLKGDLRNIQAQSPSVPVYSNVTGERMSGPGEIKEALIKQVTQPVLWQVDIENMIKDGAGVFVEVGPGKSLSGFGKRIGPEIPYVQFSLPRELDAVLDLYKGGSLE
jgi:[acyl-carrier-protein] S-malonyltransferase